MNPSFEEVKKAELAIIISLLSPGIPMLSAGQDFLRSKRGIRNTYLEPEINALDYQRLEKFKSLSSRIRSAISFRLSKRGEFTRPRSRNDSVYITGAVEGKLFRLLSRQEIMMKNFYSCVTRAMKFLISKFQNRGMHMKQFFLQ